MPSSREEFREQLRKEMREELSPEEIREFLRSAPYQPPSESLFPLEQWPMLTPEERKELSDPHDPRFMELTSEQRREFFRAFRVEIRLKGLSIEQLEAHLEKLREQEAQSKAT